MECFEMDLIQANGQPRYGRFDHVPSRINLDDYIYKTPYGQILKGWRKQLKYKKNKRNYYEYGRIIFLTI